MADSKPTLKMLQRHVIPRVASKWFQLGLELFDEKEEHLLNNIESMQKENVDKCLEMFRLWSMTYSDATWSQIVEALKSPGVYLAAVADELEKNLIVLPSTIPRSSATPQPLDITSSSSNDLETESSYKLNFTNFKDVSLAFSALFSRLQKEVKLKCDEDYDIIKTACVARANHKLTKQILKTGNINSLFRLFAVNKPHCNWLNIRFLEVIATAYGNSNLINLVDDYKKVIFSKKLREVWGCIPYHRVRTEYYSNLQAKFDGKDPDNVTVEQLKRMCEPYLLKEIAELMAIIEEGSLRITWLIPTDTVYYEAYLSALMIPKELRLDSYLQIGDWVVHHPHYALQNLQKDYWWILPSTLLIGYYHGLLMRNIDATLMVDKMCSKGLLACHDQEMILAGHSIHQRNRLLLECVRCMGIQALVKFCKFLQEILPQVGLQLMTAINFDSTSITKPQAPDKKSLLFKSIPTAYNVPSSLHVLFLDVIDQVKELLQWCDTGLLTEVLKNLMASETHKINFFSDSYIANLSNCTNAASVLQYLSYLFTWSDHSILRALVSYSPEAIQLLDEFDCFLDPFSTIVSYPVDVYSLSMAPTEDSPFTLLAIRNDKELWQCSLQDLFNMRSTLVELCEITQHCLQLVAIQSDPTLVFWNIPKCVVELICTNLLEHTEYLCSHGIVEATIYPKQLIFAGDDIIVGSFSFMIKQEESQTSVDAILKNSQETADEAKEKNEKLLNENEKLKESIEKNAMIRWEATLSSFNSKLEKMFKVMLPDDEVKAFQLVMGVYEEKNLMKQIEYNLNYLKKSFKNLDKVKMKHIKQQEVEFQYQQSLQSLKLRVGKEHKQG